jgi:hypothetical protein
MDQGVDREGKPPWISNIGKSLIFLQSSEEMKVRATRGNLTCVMCALDPTTTDAQKARKWSHSDLDVHLKSSFHSREKEWEKAVKIDGGVVSCPSCGDDGFNKSALITHLKDMHPHAMWMAGDESGSDD